MRQTNEPYELRSWQLVAIFLFACCVILTRRPDAVFHAQFWSEDGHTFFADAYNRGWWSALFGIYQGYFHTFPRLAASIALLVPLTLAPLITNLIAIGTQALPVVLLLSSRSAPWGSLRTRVLMAVVYLALPNSWEVDANITNSQTFVALNAVLVLVAAAPRTLWGRLFDGCALALCGLTGPFGIFVFPIATFLWWRDRGYRRLIQVAIIATGCFVQVWGLLHGGLSSRPHYELGASPILFARIVAGQVYLGTLWGGLGQPPHLRLGLLTFFLLVFVGGTILVVVCFLRAPMPMKLFLVLSAMLTVAPLLSATLQTLHGVTAWDVLVGGGGNRYWLFPALAFGWVIVWCFESQSRILKPASVVLFFAMCFGVAFHWRYASFPESHFAEYAKQFEAAPPGTGMTIPQDPPGWTLELVKRGKSN